MRAVAGLLLAWVPLAVSAQTAGEMEDDLFWESSGGCGNVEGGARLYLEAYPRGRHAGEARACVARWTEETAWNDVKGCKDIEGVTRFLERYPKGHYAEEARACTRAADLAQILLPDGVTLADWALLAEDRLNSGDYARLLAEANAHFRNYGQLVLIVEVRERAIAGLVAGVRITTQENARTGLKRIARIEASVGQRPELLRLKAHALRLLEEYSSADEAYVQWLQLAPQTHPDRREVLSALSLVRELPAESKKFFDLLGRQFSPDMVDETGWTDLHYAAILNLPRVAEALLEAGVNVDARLKDNLDYSDRLMETLRILGYDFNYWSAEGQTPLILAAKENAYDTARLLVDRGADIHAKYGNGGTALFVAVWKNSREIAEFLIERGADVNGGDGYGGTPLMHKANYGYTAWVEFLLSHNAEIDLGDSGGVTALMYATFGGNLETVKFLVGRGASVHTRDNNGQTVLHHATYTSEIMEALIAAGADVNAKDNDGHTPMDRAVQNTSRESEKGAVDREKRFLEAAETLRRHGGQCAKRC